MTEPVVSIDSVKQEAAAAAQRYTNVNDACPYPFYSEAGRLFKQEFSRVRLAIFTAENNAKKGLA
jgi:hypothetical protein